MVEGRYTRWGILGGGFTNPEEFEMIDIVAIDTPTLGRPQLIRSSRHRSHRSSKSRMRIFCQENDRDLAVRRNPVSDCADDVVIHRSRVLVRLAM
jgi:hypothetical protein